MSYGSPDASVKREDFHTVGTYQIVEPLEDREGVNLAQDTTHPDGEPVVIRRLNNIPMDMLLRLRRDFGILQNFVHPHVSWFHGYFEQPGECYTVCEHVAGGGLDRLVRAARASGAAESGGMSNEMVLDIGLQVANAITAAHREKIAHRGLIPASIRITQTPDIAIRSGEVLAKLVDFCIGFSLLDSAAMAGDENRRFSELAYFAPEQISLARVPSYELENTPTGLEGLEEARQGDIYSMGQLLYWLWTGLPFLKLDDSRLRTGQLDLATACHSALERNLARFRIKPPAIIKQVGAVELLLAMMSRDPAERPSSLEVEAMLKLLRRQIPVQERVEKGRVNGQLVESLDDEGIIVTLNRRLEKVASGEFVLPPFERRKESSGAPDEELDLQEPTPESIRIPEFAIGAHRAVEVVKQHVEEKSATSEAPIEPSMEGSEQASVDNNDSVQVVVDIEKSAAMSSVDATSDAVSEASEDVTRLAQDAERAFFGSEGIGGGEEQSGGRIIDAEKASQAGAPKNTEPTPISIRTTQPRRGGKERQTDSGAAAAASSAKQLPPVLPLSRSPHTVKVQLPLPTNTNAPVNGFSFKWAALSAAVAAVILFGVFELRPGGGSRNVDQALNPSVSASPQTPQVPYPVVAGASTVRGGQSSNGGIASSPTRVADGSELAPLGTSAVPPTKQGDETANTVGSDGAQNQGTSGVPAADERIVGPPVGIDAPPAGVGTKGVGSPGGTGASPASVGTKGVGSPGGTGASLAGVGTKGVGSPGGTVTPVGTVASPGTRGSPAFVASVPPKKPDSTASVAAKSPLSSIGKVKLESRLPRLAALDLNGQALSTEKIMREKKPAGLMVYLWNVDCSACGAGLDRLSRNRSHLNKEQIEVLLVNLLDDPEVVSGYISQRGLSQFRVMRDGTGAVVDSLGLGTVDALSSSLPISIIVNHEGVVQWIQKEGSENNVAQILNILRIPAAP